MAKLAYFPINPDKDDGETSPRRIIRKTLTCLQNHQDALVDSGAEQIVFGGDVADNHAIRQDDGDEALITGVNGEPLAGRRVEVDLRPGRQLWRAPVIFVPELDHQLILGQAGFFAFFAVTFRYRAGRMDIRRAR